LNFRLTDSDDNDGVDSDEWLEEEEEDPYKLRIIQNTTDISNDIIEYIFEIVNPLYETEEYGPTKLPLQDLVVRIIYESERDDEFLDNGVLGSYSPQMHYLNQDGLEIVEKPIITVIVPDRNTTFPLYSNYPIRRDFENKDLPITKRTAKLLKQARVEIGHSVILYLSLEELLIRVIAHELRHHWQHVTGFVKHIDDDMSSSEIEQINLEGEKDADAYAVKQVRIWRKLHHPLDAYPDANWRLHMRKHK
jgi:hypothetical protein